MTTPGTTVERILFPTDFSSFSNHALRHALALTRRFKARLKVVHVIPQVLPTGDADYFGAPWLITPEARQHVDEEMRRFLAPAREARIDYQTEICEGDPWREIVALAGEMAADLVVMGTHGRSGIEHLLLGSVAEKLIRRLPCPVLTVCREEGRTWEAPGLVTRILCATDFSETSANALEMALAFATEAKVQVTLLHVVENIPEFGSPMNLGLPDLGPLRQDLEQAARERLQKMASGAEGSGARIETRVVFGRAYKEILRIAAEERADLLVIGAQGHGVIEHMLSGSNAQQVIRAATCPVLTVRPLRVGPRKEPRAGGLTLAATAAPKA
jgi:nucleotide-binding universal stress UspA family protein